MRLTDALVGEHGLLYALFGHIEGLIRNEADASAVAAASATLESLLISHATLEEELLFKELEPHLGEGGPLSVMRAEHEEIDRLLAEARNAADGSHRSQSLVRAIEQARNHFRKEEMVLFPMARRVLGDEALLSRGADWARARNVTLD